MRKFAIFLLFLPLCWPTSVVAMRTRLLFPSADGLMIHADYYTISPYRENRPLIILFHQAGWSRGEYRETAPKLNDLGYHCLAVDLRSGNAVNGVRNETAAEARKTKKKTGYLDAWPDLEATVAYAKAELKPGRIILLGSSYSASLILRYAASKPGAVSGLIAFSPGEYFSREGKERNWIGSAAKTVRIPVWITSAGDELHLWKGIYDAVPSAAKSFFLPKGRGRHGSRALWSDHPDSAEYWAAMSRFLDDLKKK